MQRPYRFTLIALLFVGTTLPVTSYASAAAKPTVVTVPVPADTPKPPDEAFFTQEHVVPSLTTLQAEQAEQQAPASTASASQAQSGLQTPKPMVFRTLGDAARAGVNPMTHLKPISLGTPHKPTPRTLWTRIHLFVYAGLVLLLLLTVAYVLFSPRLGRSKEP